MSSNANYMSMATQYTYCTCGTAKQKVFLEESHGVINQRDGQPVLNANDHKYPDNIKGYGRCKADAADVQELLEKYGDVRIDTDKYAGRTCYPILNEAWKDGDTHFTIQGAPVLLDTSKLVCARGGIIKFVKPGSDADSLPDSIDASYSSFDEINSNIAKIEAAVAKYLPNKGHFTLGDKKNGPYAEAFVDPFDAEHRQTEGKMGTSGIEMEHGNSTQGKMGVEVGYSKDDFNIAAGTEVEIGKIKSDSEKLQVEPSDVKAYAKIEAKKKNLKISRGIITGDIEAEIESGEYKAKYGSERKKRKRTISAVHSEKQDDEEEK
ncbi:protein of unknown function [Selenomonas sp. GACV-9]|uniref:DUF4280 domain-containing protein n=1 Tax=Selenomonas sp. GACV-9 TaxID=3158782 RepID=UPI0008EDF529|nr:protein of unknown function [Selenomonas ruminantium]